MRRGIKVIQQRVRKLNAPNGKSNQRRRKKYRTVEVNYLNYIACVFLYWHFLSLSILIFTWFLGNIFSRAFLSHSLRIVIISFRVRSQAVLLVYNLITNNIEWFTSTIKTVRCIERSWSVQMEILIENCRCHFSTFIAWLPIACVSVPL